MKTNRKKDQRKRAKADAKAIAANKARERAEAEYEAEKQAAAARRERDAAMDAARRARDDAEWADRNPHCQHSRSHQYHRLHSTKEGNHPSPRAGLRPARRTATVAGPSSVRAAWMLIAAMSVLG